MTVSVLKPMAAAAALAAAGIVHAAAAPTLIDFDTLKGGKLLPALVGSTYSEDGYTMTSLFRNDLFATAAFVDADHKGETLSSSSMTFQATSGAAFDLQSLDLSNALNTRGGRVLFTYQVANEAPVSEWLGLDNKVGLQTFVLNLADLRSFNLTSLAFQVDNIKVTAVPEPDALALMLAGLGIVATLARRRKA